MSCVETIINSQQLYVEEDEHNHYLVQFYVNDRIMKHDHIELVDLKYIENIDNKHKFSFTVYTHGTTSKEHNFEIIGELEQQNDNQCFMKNFIIRYIIEITEETFKS